MQVYRVTDKIGELSEGLVGEAESQALVVTAHDVVYAELDGAMVLTREDKWQEVKTGRIFRQSDITALSPTRLELKSSLYASHLGSYAAFLEKFEPMVDVFDPLGNRLVFITDGATWIRNWTYDNYPNATHILDYYHACEHLATWLGLVIKDETIRQALLQEWKGLLLDKGVNPIIKKVSDYEVSTKQGKIERQKLLNYLNTNAYRMQYHLYRARGLQIGSGAIESAQRTVLQKRLKRSGQRWSETGVQNMLNLRVAHLSNHWTKIVNTIVDYKAAA